MSLMSLERDGSCSKFKIATESPLDSVWTLPKHSTKRRFPFATTRGMAEEERFCTIRTYGHVSCLGCRMLAFFFPAKSEQLLLPHSRPTFLFKVGKKRNKSMVHRASLDALMSFLPGCCCKIYSMLLSVSHTLPCLAKFLW